MAVSEIEEVDVEAPLLVRVQEAPPRAPSRSKFVLLLGFVVTTIFLAFTLGYWTSMPNGESRGGFRHERKRVVEVDLAVVAADEERCSAIGRDSLRLGGNAVDATVATALCLGVLNPMASGIGGGAFLLLRLANGSSEIYDMRETAPAAASMDMYESDPDSKRKGALSVGVPGELAGLYMAWKRHGQLPWETLVRPAIYLAANGFVVQPYLAHHIQLAADDILANKGLADIFAPNGKLLSVGDICLRKNLSQTLKEVAKHGPSALYNGAIGENLITDVRAAGGILTVQDLQHYTVQIRQPIVTETMGFTVLGMPPPSSGGACIALILNILAKYGDTVGTVGVLGLHRMIEAFKHAYAVRMGLADPAFVNITSVLEDMLNPDIAAELQKLISDNTTFPSGHYGGRWSQLEDHGTSHFSIVDADRNAVAMTTTINFPFGSKLLSPSTGIILNNEMDDFAIPSFVPPGYLPPPPQNFVAPNKRPLSSMSPTIVLQNGQLRAVVGGSGGQMIITAVVQVLMNHFMKKISPFYSISAARVHHQLSPNTVNYENWTTVTGEHLELERTAREGLQQKGHLLEARVGAIVQLVLQDLTVPAKKPYWHQRNWQSNNIFYGKLIGVSDERKDGAPAGL